MNSIMVDIKAQHRYRTTRLGSLYDTDFCELADDFLRNIGRFDPYDPDVSRDDVAGEDG